ncbi:MAG: hypothetical protein M3428_01330, partial [Pseudomonadota bacterium]|nr:hypothetical protein [Pseudomonadota bacterium]
AVAERLLGPDTVAAVRSDQSEAYARRAVTLAPNLAQAHAALGFAAGLTGPVAEAALRRAIELDPSDVQSINWLASIESQHGRLQRVLDLYDKAIEIEPLWWPVVLNRLSLLLNAGRDNAVSDELARLDRSGSWSLATRARASVLTWRGDLSEALKLELAAHRRAGTDRREIGVGIGFLLLQLGYFAEAVEFGKPPPFAPDLWRNDPRGLDMVEKARIAPEFFWRLGPLAENAGRVYVLSGRGDGLVRWYRAAANSPEHLLASVEHRDRFIHLAPLVALALRQTGDEAEADRLIIAADEALLAQRISVTRRRAYYVNLARIRSVQGRADEAAAALGNAIRQGWLPDAPAFLADLATDPPLALIKGTAGFKQARAHVRAQFARERAELGPVRLHP